MNILLLSLDFAISHCENRTTPKAVHEPWKKQKQIRFSRPAEEKMSNTGFDFKGEVCYLGYCLKVTVISEVCFKDLERFLLA